VETLEDRGEDVRRDGGGGAEGELAGAPARDVADVPTALADGLERPLRVGEEGPAGIREPHAPTRAHEERHAELSLETFQSRGERRLRDEERPGGAADAAAARRLHEALDLGEEHEVMISAIFMKISIKKNWTYFFTTPTLA
jgi:hypothetical protein